MQNFGNGKLVFSASDLANASECLWAQVRRIDKALGFEIEVPKDNDSMLARAGALGDVHEQKQLERYREEFGDGVVEIARPDYKNQSKSIEDQMLQLNAQTLAALEQKNPVVFQATFFDGEFQGFADFLVLTPEGEYAVYDTKLARKAKITALIQLAAYAHQLQQNGIRTSDQVHLILGDLTKSTHALEDILPTYLKRRHDMIELINQRRANRNGGGAALEWGDDTYSACGRCAVCEPQVVQSNDLFGVAGMRVEQRAKLRAAGIETISQLTLALEKPDGMSEKTFSKLKSQALVQIRTLMHGDNATPVFEVIEPAALSLIPASDDGDIFFDFEGDPLYQEGTYWNLDYLFGWVDKDRHFEPLWAHDLAGERKALIDFANYVRERKAKHPLMHIYHYAPYEKTHLLSMAARHGVEEEFVDQLLRDNVLVDLYPIVRRAVLVGSQSYSLKKLEPIFVLDEEREGVANAADSVVEYANYCELKANGQHEAAEVKLKSIEDYNAYDCRSTLALRNWMADLAGEHGVELRGFIAPEKREEIAPDPVFVELSKFIENVPVAERNADQTAIALAAAAIDFHRREQKSFWWEHYARLEAPLEDWQDTRDVFVVEKTEVERDWHKEGRQRSERRHLRLFTTPAPGSKMRENADVHLVYASEAEVLIEPLNPKARAAVKAKVIEIINDFTFVVEELLSKDSDRYDVLPEAITPGAPPKTPTLQAAIVEWGQDIVDSLPALPRNSALDILRKVAPFGRPLPQLDADNAAANITQSLLTLGSSYIAVQGPPGAGKSFNGGHVIAELVLKHNWKVGVIAQSHATVENLLRAVSKAGVPEALIGKSVKSDQAVAEVQDLTSTVWTALGREGAHEFLAANSGCVIGGTVWDFTNTGRIERQELDLLVIDEAGQFSLANTIAASVSAKRLLLLGDPQQLPQVTQGVHPEPIDGSALGWLAGDDEVISPDFGYFLPSSFRMNKEVCSVVSENYYNGKLGSRAPERNLVGVAPGFHRLPISHSGNSTESVEEAEAVVELVRGLMTKQWNDGQTAGPLAQAPENIIVVAPYNAQVQLLRRKLDGAGFREVPVGTVDKFQGQEAAVAIVSLTASSADEVPRGVEFLLMPNRLNVAISRAKWASYLVYSPELMNFRPTNVDNLRLLSRFINLVGINNN
ncbi:MAG: hypothetical protein RL196_310 [Actinomycetota bacterium]|jgi:uncharacterized protein